MIRIELSPNDKKDLLKLIDICLKHKEIFVYDRTNWVKWWEIRLEQLIQVINGYQYSSYVSSSMETMERDKDQKEKLHQYYLDHLEGDILNVLNSE